MTVGPDTVATAPSQAPDAGSIDCAARAEEHCQAPCFRDMVSPWVVAKDCFGEPHVFLACRPPPVICEGARTCRVRLATGEVYSSSANCGPADGFRYCTEAERVAAPSSYCTSP